MNVRHFSSAADLPKRATVGASAGGSAEPNITTAPLVKSAQWIALVLFAVILVGHSPRSAAYVCVSVDATTHVVFADGTASPCANQLLLTQADYDTARSPFASDPDWDVVQWAAGACVLMFAIGAGIGLIFSIVRKAK